jgi:hypothetical protein
MPYLCTAVEARTPQGRLPALPHIIHILNPQDIGSRAPMDDITVARRVNTYELDMAKRRSCMIEEARHGSGMVASSLPRCVYEYAPLPHLSLVLQ